MLDMKVYEPRFSDLVPLNIIKVNYLKGRIHYWNWI